MSTRFGRSPRLRARSSTERAGARCRSLMTWTTRSTSGSPRSAMSARTTPRPTLVDRSVVAVMKVAWRSHSSRPVSTAVGGVGELGQRRDDEVAAGRPAPVDGRLVDAGPGGHVLDAQPGKAMLADEFEGGPEHVGDDARAPPADARLRGASGR